MACVPPLGNKPAVFVTSRLQTDSTEEDAFNMLGNAIIDTVADDPTHTEALLEVWSEFEEQRKLQ